MMTAAGPISLPREKLAAMVGLSSTFQARVNASAPTEAQAREHIHWPHLRTPDPGDALLWDQWMFPFAVIVRPEAGALRYEHVAGTARNYLRPLGTFDLFFGDRDRVPEDLQESQEDFENFVGQTLADVAALAGAGEHLSITAIEEATAPGFTHPEDQPAGPVYWLGHYLIHWGRV